MNIRNFNYPYAALAEGEGPYDNFDLSTAGPISAVYSKSPVDAYNGNCFIEAIPKPKDGNDLVYKYTYNLVSYDPGAIQRMSYNDRINQLGMLHQLRVPLSYQLQLEEIVYQTMCTAYANRIIMTDESTNAANTPNRVCTDMLASSVKGFALIGRAGSGKTTSIGLCLSSIPQVIVHTGSFGKITQIPYLIVNCVPNNNFSGLLANIGAAVDKALNMNSHLYESMIVKQSTIEKKLFHVKNLIENFAIGLIILDEIQHLAFSNVKSDSFEHLLSLSNETNVAFGVIGNEDAWDKLFQNERMARRSGPIIKANTSCENQEIFHIIISKIFKYQWFDDPITLTPEMEMKLYLYSRGVIDHMITIFMCLQMEYLRLRKKGYSVDVNVDFLDKVIEHWFSGLMGVLKKRDDAKKEASIEEIFSESHIMLNNIMEDSAPKEKDCFLSSVQATESITAAYLETAVVQNIRKCFPGYTDQQIQAIFKKVYGIKANRGKNADELTALVVNKLLASSKPPRQKKISEESININLSKVGM